MRIPTAFLGVCLSCNSSGSKTPGADPSSSRGGGKMGLRAQADKVEPEPGAFEPHLGVPAPDVSLVLQNGRTLKLSDLRGKNVVLFFYPMDDTPGCRAEAQGFRDRFGHFQQANTTVLGVSLQGKESHQAFIDKERLPFDLVVDVDAKVSEAFGVPIHGQVAARQTFLVDEAGVVAHVWRSVSPAQHPEEVLALVRK
jgi:thioredoxin-dependent peroxiredoxin